MVCYKNPLLKEDWETVDLNVVATVENSWLQESSIKRGLRAYDHTVLHYVNIVQLQESSIKRGLRGWRRPEWDALSPIQVTRILY